LQPAAASVEKRRAAKIEPRTRARVFIPDCPP
jgi:hypothetical protein